MQVRQTKEMADVMKLSVDGSGKVFRGQAFHVQGGYIYLDFKGRPTSPMSS